MIKYATNDDICRSRQLLRYFGEERSTDCGQCDVCIAHKKQHEDKNGQKKAEELITELLNDMKPHYITEIKEINFDRDIVEDVFEYMINEEIIYVADGMVALRRKRNNKTDK